MMYVTAIAYGVLASVIMTFWLNKVYVSEQDMTDKDILVFATVAFGLFPEGGLPLYVMALTTIIDTWMWCWQRTTLFERLLPVDDPARGLRELVDRARATAANELAMQTDSENKAGLAKAKEVLDNALLAVQQAKTRDPIVLATDAPFKRVGETIELTGWSAVLEQECKCMKLQIKTEVTGDSAKILLQF